MRLSHIHEGDNPLDNIMDEFGHPCPECGDNLDEVEGANCCHGIDRYLGKHGDPFNMTWCTTSICWRCLYNIDSETGMSYSGWFIDQDRGEYYCPDHAAEAQAAFRTVENHGTLDS